MGGGSWRWNRKNIIHLSLLWVCLSPHHLPVPSAMDPGPPLSSWHCAKQHRTNGQNNSLGSRALSIQWGRQLHKQIITYCHRYALQNMYRRLWDMAEEVANPVWSQSQRNWNLGKASHGALHYKTQPSWYGLLGSPVCVSLSDWINERHAFLTVLESGKSRSLALGFQHINFEETQAIYGSVSLQVKSHHPSCLTLFAPSHLYSAQLCPLCSPAEMLHFSLWLWTFSVKDQRKLYLLVTSSLIISAHSGLPILDSTPHSGVLLWSLILSDIVISLILSFNSSIIDLIPYFPPPQLKLKALNRRLHYLMFHMDCRKV